MAIKLLLCFCFSSQMSLNLIFIFIPGNKQRDPRFLMIFLLLSFKYNFILRRRECEVFFLIKTELTNSLFPTFFTFAFLWFDKHAHEFDKRIFNKENLRYRVLKLVSLYEDGKNLLFVWLDSAYISIGLNKNNSLWRFGKYFSFFHRRIIWNLSIFHLLSFLVLIIIFISCRCFCGGFFWNCFLLNVESFKHRRESLMSWKIQIFDLSLKCLNFEELSFQWQKRSMKRLIHTSEFWATGFKDFAWHSPTSHF